jgi:hypothetical protein
MGSVIGTKFLKGVVRTFERVRALEQRMDRYEASHQALHDAAEKVMGAEKENIAKELVHLNKLRQEVVADRGEFPRRGELKALEVLIDTRLRPIEKFQENLKGRFAAMGALMGALLVIAEIVMKFLWK